MKAAPLIRLLLLEDARDADGQPRAGLVVPPGNDNPTRRPLLMLFGSVGAAVAAKRDMEAPR